MPTGLFCHPITLAIAFGACLCGSLGPARGADGPPPALVRVAPVRHEQVQQHRLVIGQIEPGKRSVVAAEQTGRVTEAPPEPGTTVKAGQIMARTDATLLELDVVAAAAQVELADAQVAERRALLQTAQRNAQRLAKLLKSSSALQKELDDATDEQTAAASRLTLARAMKARAEAQHLRLKRQVVKTAVTAPFSGTVVRKATELGQWLEPGDAVVEIVMLDRLKVRLQVPQQFINHARAGQVITVRVDALNMNRSEKVFSVIPDADPKARAFDVLLKLDNKDGALKPGMSVTAYMPTGRMVKSITVPRDAVQTTPSGAVVFVDRNGRAVMEPIIIKFGFGDRLAVDGALRAGDRVVVEGNERLRSGQPLKVMAPKASE